MRRITNRQDNEISHPIYAFLSCDRTTSDRGKRAAARVTHFLYWLLIGWALVSALATPFVGRFVASHVGDTDDDLSSEPVASHIPVMTRLPNPEP